MQRPYLLKKRAQIWYYRLANENTFHSTGQTSKTAAINFAQQRLDRRAHRVTAPRLREYAAAVAPLVELHHRRPC